MVFMATKFDSSGHFAEDDNADRHGAGVGKHLDAQQRTADESGARLRRIGSVSTTHAA